MNTARAREHLMQAERYVVEGQRHIAEQRAKIENAKRAGLDTTANRILLSTFEDSQALLVAELERLRAEIHETN